MKTAIYLNLILIASILLAGCVVHEHRPVSVPVYTPPPPPPVVVTPPPPRPPVIVTPPPRPPAVVVPPPHHPRPVILVPEYYIWDGHEYIGWTGNTYLYYGPHGWVAADKHAMNRFHKWQKKHPNWREEGTRYQHGHNPHR